MIVVADDLGTENLACYGRSERMRQPPTPNLNGMAAAGLRFAKAYAHPICSPTRASLLTGLLPGRTGIGANVSPGDPERLRPEQVTLFEALRRGGYTCGMVGKWHLGADTPFLEPLLHGTDLFLGTRITATPNYWQFDQRLLMPWTDRPLPPTRYGPEEFTDHLLTLQQVLPEPWCLILNHHTPHSPYHVPPQALHHYGFPTDDPTKYLAMVEALDTEMGRLLRGLDLADTTVIFLADNGTPKPVSRYPDRAKGTVYEGGVHVPLLMAGAGVQRVGEISQSLVSVTDLYATVLELAGVAGGTPDSESFADALWDPGFLGRRMVAAERFRPNGPGPKNLWLQMARDQRYKLIRDEVLGTEQLFDLWKDPNELSPLAPAGLDRQSRRSYLALARYLDQLPPP